jgi:hypothetical protein
MPLQSGNSVAPPSTTSLHGGCVGGGRGWRGRVEGEGQEVILGLTSLCNADLIPCGHTDLNVHGLHPRT